MSSHAFFRLVLFSKFSASFQTLPLSVVRLLLRSFAFGLALFFPILVCRIVPRVAWSLRLVRICILLSVAFPVSVWRSELEFFSSLCLALYVASFFQLDSHPLSISWFCVSVLFSQASISSVLFAPILQQLVLLTFVVFNARSCKSLPLTVGLVSF